MNMNGMITPTMYSWNIIKRIGHLCRGIKHYKNKKDKANMMQLADRIYDGLNETQKSNVSIISGMMKCLMNNNQNDKAILLYTKHYNDSYNDELNTLFIKACINTNDYSQCKLLINSINASNLEDHSIQLITILIRYYGKTGDVECALDVFDRIPISKKNTVAINVMMRCFMDNDENQKAITLYEEYETVNINQIVVDDISHNLYIKACINASQYKNAKIFIKTTVKDINNHSIEFLNTLIDFYGKCNDIDAAWDIFENI